MKFATQDLVHPPPRLEAVQIVLGRLGLDVRGLVRQLGARRVDALALRLQHARDRILGQPVDLRSGTSARSSRAIATSRCACPKPIGEEM